MTNTLRNNVLVHWAIPVERTLSVHACDKICLSEDIRLFRSKHMRLSHTLRIVSIGNIRGPGEAKNIFPQSVRRTSSPFKIRLIPHIMNPFYA